MVRVFFYAEAWPIGGVGVLPRMIFPKVLMFFKNAFNTRKLKIQEVPEALRHYCIFLNDEECLVPERFDRMEIGCYINHSFDPNIARMNLVDPLDVINSLKVRALYAIKDIKVGDEITINYNNLQEPEHLKEEYYKSNE